MKLKISHLILFILLINIFSANATIRFVSKTGTNTPPYTSWETASDSIQKCINICVDGDTIYVANGIYKENLVINNISLYLFGSSMDSTVIDGTGLSDSTIFFNNSNSIIENFNIYGKSVGSYSYAVAYQDLPLNIKNCRISRTGYGIVSIGNAGVIALNLILETITVHGFGLFNNSYNEISNCLILLNNDYASGIYIGGPNPNSIYTITNNIILFPENDMYGKSGIILEAPGKVYIYNNLISGNFDSNIWVGNNVIDTVFIKNNILLYQPNGWGSINAAASKTVVKNVIMMKNHTGIFSYGRTKSDYNIFWNNEKNLNGLTYGDSDRVADPMFIKDTIPNAQLDFDYHLQAYSPAIDKGDPNILDVDGSRSDIGMYGGPFGETYTYQDLAPLAPRNLSAIVDTNLIILKWNRNTEADTAYYKVYRDTTINFTIDSTKLVLSSGDSFFVQLNPHISTRYVYKITCVDNQGNESLPSNELVVNITSVSTDDYPMTISNYVLNQNYPNPFNPSTKIGYQLKQRAYVKLMVYDIKGELVTVLVNKEQNAGYYETEFSTSGIQHPESSIKGIASGIYLYRIEIIGEENIPVFTDMKKMILLK